MRCFASVEDGDDSFTPKLPERTSCTPPCGRLRRAPPLLLRCGEGETGGNLEVGVFPADLVEFCASGLGGALIEGCRQFPPHRKNSAALGVTSLSSGWRHPAAMSGSADGPRLTHLRLTRHGWRPAAPSRFADGPGLPSLAARARLAKRCFASGCAGPPRTPCAPCHTGAGAEVHVSAASARRVGYRMYPIQACFASRFARTVLTGGESIPALRLLCLLLQERGE